MAYKAIIAGASGLTGGILLDILLQQPDYDEVLLLLRKELPIRHQKLTQLVIDFDRLGDYEGQINGHAVFCCLGSTRKKTPDLSVYRKIDHDYPLQLAQIAAKNGIDQYHLVSALGANAASSNFYTKMKGETEEDIKKVGLKCLHIYRPSFLSGNRSEKRPLERFFSFIIKFIDPLLIGGLKKYRSIPAATVARAMYKQSLKNEEGVFIHSSDNIKQL
ncbi:MAG TPA: nucleoside-diphosphate sugar epimerase [Mucilaginibacter sp.]|nr:nucleoside-diphosphate sugar epimerase [Mucilaginibacter sp.]